jgi:GcrA cell cycle regulator
MKTAATSTGKASPTAKAASPITTATQQPIREGRTCSWPIGDPAQSDFHFCGAKRDAGQSYCAEHIQLAYQKGTKRGKTLSHSLSVASRSSARNR